MNFITKAAQDLIRVFELNDTLTKFANWFRKDIFRGNSKQVVKANGEYYTLTTGVTPGSYTVVSLTVNEFGQITTISSGTSGGTVTSVQLSAGTGISIGGTNPITTSGTINVTNTAPDQTVVLTNGTGISITGTYPNFTITNTSPSNVWTVFLICANTTFANNTTYYFGAYPVAAASTTANNNYVTIPYSCVLVGATISLRIAGTLSTGGTATVYARINNTTDVTLSSVVTTTAVQQKFTVTGLSTDISAGDTIEIKFACPVAWTTAAPTQVQVRVDLYFR